MPKLIKSGWKVAKPEGTSKVSTPEEKELDLVLRSFMYSRQFYSAKFEEFKRFKRLYDQIPDQKETFRSNLFIPMVYPIVSTIQPRMVANLPKFKYQPREKSDSKLVKQMDVLTDYQLDRMEFFKKLKMWVKDTLMYGTGIVKVFWRNEANQSNREVVNPYNDPDCSLVDLLDFYPDPKAVDIDSGDFLIHRTVTSLQFLKRAKDTDGKPLYENLDQVKDGWADDTSNQSSINTRDMTVGEVGAGTQLGSPYRQSISKQVEILEYWGVNPNEEYEEYVITVANRNTVIRSERNPFKGKRPFVKMHIDPENHAFHGKGVIGPIEHLQLELNDIRNQRMDNVNLIINRMFFVLRSANVDKQDLVSRPGGYIEMDLPGGVTPMVVPDVTQSSYQEESLVKQDAQSATGVSDIIQGQLRSADESVPGTALNKTATGAAIAVQQAGSRFKYYLQNIEDALKDFGEKLYQYNQQFLDEEKFVRVTAPNDYQAVKKRTLVDKVRGLIGLQEKQEEQYEFVRISPDDIRNLKLDIAVEAGSTQPIEELERQKKAMALFQMLSQLPVVTPDTYLVLAQRLLEAFDVKDQEQLLRTLAAPQGAGPKTSVSVSLKGDLNPYQAAEIAKQAGASEQSTDPELVSALDSQERVDELTKTAIKDAGKFNAGAGGAPQGTA